MQLHSKATLTTLRLHQDKVFFARQETKVKANRLGRLLRYSATKK